MRFKMPAKLPKDMDLIEIIKKLLAINTDYILRSCGINRGMDYDEVVRQMKEDPAIIALKIAQQEAMKPYFNEVKKYDSKPRP